MADHQGPLPTSHFVILPHQRVPIPARLRFAAEVMNAAQAVPKGAPAMRQARCFRLAMEKQRRRVLRAWKGTVR
jgi:hypothetical protein